MNSCILCHSENIKRNIKVTDIRGLEIGLKIKSLIIPDCEFLLASVCNDCGNVHLYVIDSNHNWE